MGCVPEHCSLCFPCYLQNPPLSTEREIKCVFIRAQAPLDTAPQPEPRQTQWLIERPSPSACSQHTPKGPSYPPKCTDVHPRPELAATVGEGGRSCSGGQRHDALVIQTYEALEFSLLLFLPKAQQFATIIANFPSCEMRRALFLMCCSQTEHGVGGPACK